MCEGSPRLETWLESEIYGGLLNRSYKDVNSLRKYLLDDSGEPQSAIFLFAYFAEELCSPQI